MDASQSLLAALRDTFLLEGAPPEAAALLLQQPGVEVVSFLPGQVIYDAAHYRACMGLVLSGQVEVYSALPERRTLLNILGLLDNPTSGSYTLLDHEVAGFKEKDRTKFRKGNIGFVFQSFNLIDELNVFENVELPLIYMRVKASERKRRVNEILSRMNISHRAEHFPQQLSGGQQQRVAIARAVVSNPKLILADEPTGNLDSKNGREVMELLSELNREGTTVIMVTHSQHDSTYAHRVLHLFDGELVKDLANKL